MLKPMQQLDYLSVYQTQIDAPMIRELREALPYCLVIPMTP